jgi:hypothetical protein
MECYLCSKSFFNRSNLNKHLNTNACKISKLPKDIHTCISAIQEESLLKDKVILQKDKMIAELEEKLKYSQQIIENNHNSTINSQINSNNINIIIQVQPIDKLNMDYIKKEDLQIMFDKLNKDQVGNMDMVLKNYIQSLIANPDHPENHAVKYTKKDPPMFRTLITDANNTEKHVINDLKDTCDLISEPLIEQMLKKIKASWREFRQDPDFDETMDVNLLEDLRSKLKNENVRRILKRFIRSDILENVNMKIEKTQE